MRLFTAIAFPEDRKSAAGDFFRGRLPVAYVNTANLHVTLNFLGEIEDEKLGLVKRICREAVQGNRRFALEFAGVVKFHQQLHMTIKPNKDLERLQFHLENYLRQAGFIFLERAYYPHVKLANMHMDKVMNHKHRIENLTPEDLSPLNFFAEEVSLFESKLLMHHAHHTALEGYKLT